MISFFIKKSSDLPLLQVEVLLNGRNLYDFSDITITGSTVYFSMYDEETGIKKILKDPVTIVSSGEKLVLKYQFNRNKIKKTGNFIGEFFVTNSRGNEIIPIYDKIYITVIESIFNEDYIECCGPDQNIIVIPSQTPSLTPTITPTNLASNTPIPTVTPTKTPTTTPTNSVTPTNTVTPTVTPTFTPTNTKTPTPTPTPTSLCPINFTSYSSDTINCFGEYYSYAYDTPPDDIISICELLLGGAVGVDEINGKFNTNKINCTLYTCSVNCDTEVVVYNSQSQTITYDTFIDTCLQNNPSTPQTSGLPCYAYNSSQDQIYYISYSGYNPNIVPTGNELVTIQKYVNCQSYHDIFVTLDGGQWSLNGVTGNPTITLCPEITYRFHVYTGATGAGAEFVLGRDRTELGVTCVNGNQSPWDAYCGEIIYGNNNTFNEAFYTTVFKPWSSGPNSDYTSSPENAMFYKDINDETNYGYINIVSSACCQSGITVTNTSTSQSVTFTYVGCNSTVYSSSVPIAFPGTTASTSINRCIYRNSITFTSANQGTVNTTNIGYCTGCTDSSAVIAQCNQLSLNWTTDGGQACSNIFTNTSTYYGPTVLQDGDHLYMDSSCIIPAPVGRFIGQSGNVFEVINTDGELNLIIC